jgi:hypothetical protein
MQYGQKKRSYSTKKTTLDLIGVSNFDECRNKKDLHFTLEKAYRKYERDLKTKSAERIKSVIKKGIVKDVSNIIVRNLAIQYRENQRMRNLRDFSEGRNSSLNQTNKSYSPQKSILGGGTARGSPSKFSGSPVKRGATGDSFRIGFKSEFGETMGGGSTLGSPSRAQVGFADSGKNSAVPTAARIQMLKVGDITARTGDDMKSTQRSSQGAIPYPWNLDLEEIEAKILDEETELAVK